MRLQQAATLPSLLSGAAIIAAGVVLLLDQTGVIQIREVLQYWPGILLGIGAWKLTEKGTFNKLLGADLLIVGALLMAHQLHYLRLRPQLFIGVFLVLFGLHFVAQALDPDRVRSGELSEGMLRRWAIFGGTHERFTASDFRGGDLSTVFGGLEIDLRNATMAGDRADLYVSCMFGGVDNKTREREIKDEHPKTLYLKGMVVFGGIEIKS